jgi:hypothetical protein
LHRQIALLLRERFLFNEKNDGVLYRNGVASIHGDVSDGANGSAAVRPLLLDTPFRHTPCGHPVSPPTMQTRRFDKSAPPHSPSSLRTLQIPYRPTLRAPRTAYRMDGPPRGARRTLRRLPRPHLRALRHPYPTAQRWLPRMTRAERPPFRKVALPLDVTKSAQLGRARGSRRGL